MNDWLINHMFSYPHRILLAMTMLPMGWLAYGLFLLRRNLKAVQEHHGEELQDLWARIRELDGELLRK